MTLYHYTCWHSAEQLGEAGTLEPRGILPLVWATDLDHPDRNGLGLTMRILDCDRGEFRYRVVDEDEALFAHWADVKRARALPVDYAAALEAADGVLPMHWWVAIDPVRVIRD